MNLEIDLNKLSDLMEEMANQPDPGPQPRQPGEKCSYEIQRRENDLVLH
jgi:hypothetical protein